MLHNFACVTKQANKMRAKSIFLMAIMPWLLSNNVLAGETDPNPKPQPIDVRTGNHQQPRTLGPSCYYYDGCVYIEGAFYETSISGTVTRAGDDNQWSNTANGNTLQILVPTTPGTYTLTFTLSSGVTYTGEYILTD